MARSEELGMAEVTREIRTLKSPDRGLGLLGRFAARAARRAWLKTRPAAAVRHASASCVRPSLPTESAGV
jgi:hypothetical protein